MVQAPCQHAASPRRPRPTRLSSSPAPISTDCFFFFILSLAARSSAMMFYWMCPPRSPPCRHSAPSASRRHQSHKTPITEISSARLSFCKCYTITLSFFIAVLRVAGYKLQCLPQSPAPSSARAAAIHALDPFPCASTILRAPQNHYYYILYAESPCYISH